MDAYEFAINLIKSNTILDYETYTENAIKAILANDLTQDKFIDMLNDFKSFEGNNHKFCINFTGAWLKYALNGIHNKDKLKTCRLIRNILGEEFVEKEMVCGAAYHQLSTENAIKAILANDLTQDKFIDMLNDFKSFEGNNHKFCINFTGAWLKYALNGIHNKDKLKTHKLIRDVLGEEFVEKEMGGGSTPHQLSTETYTENAIKAILANDLTQDKFIDMLNDFKSFEGNNHKFCINFTGAWLKYALNGIHNKDKLKTCRLIRNILGEEFVEKERGCGAAPPQLSTENYETYTENAIKAILANDLTQDKFIDMLNDFKSFEGNNHKFCINFTGAWLKYALNGIHNKDKLKTCRLIRDVLGEEFVEKEMGCGATPHQLSTENYEKINWKDYLGDNIKKIDT